jgi:hypothetical protein
MTNPRFQIAIDCADPHALVRFWAAVTGHQIEDHSALVAEMIDAGHASVDDAVEIDGHLQWAEASACFDPSGQAPRLLFQKVPEGKCSEGRVA